MDKHTSTKMRSISIPVGRKAGRVEHPGPGLEIPRPSPKPPNPAPKPVPKPAKGDCGCGGHAKSNGCGCGCSCSCESECCGLDCIERPRFFCGQLLTNQDLDALVGWTQKRLALSRYVDGWGVACGLDVTCSPNSPASVEIGSGYAVDCCGNDIVVCAPKTVDLSDACKSPKDPCADLNSWARGKEGVSERRIVHVDLALRYAETGSDPQSALAQGPCGQVATCENTRIQEGCEVVWTEAEAGTSPIDAAAKRWLEAWKCCCEIVDQFERRFGGTLSDRPDPAIDPDLREEIVALRRRLALLQRQFDTASERERPKIQAQIDELKAALEELLNRYDRDDRDDRYDRIDDAGRLAASIRRFLIGWLDEHPLTQFCFVRDMICEAEDEQLVTPRTLVPLLWAIVQDCRNALARCSCGACETSDGVPLARICLEVGGGKSSCRVISIDPYPPYRRELAGHLDDECWPAPLGAVNLAGVLWRREHDACRRLADRGVHARLPGKPREVPRSFDQLLALCKLDPFARCGDEICLETIDATELCLGDQPRVFAWAPCRGEEPKPDPKPQDVNLDPRKLGTQRVDSSVGQIAYSLGFACENPNPFPVQVTYIDHLDPRLTYAQTVDGPEPVVQPDGRRLDWSFEVAAETNVQREWRMVTKFQPVARTVTVVNRADIVVKAPDGTDVGTFQASPVQTVIVAGEVVAEPTPSGDLTKDDLTKIRGIAAGRERVLLEHGIDSYDKLAQVETSTLVEIFPTVAERFLAQWQDEAKRLAAKDLS